MVMSSVQVFCSKASKGEEYHINNSKSFTQAFPKSLLFGIITFGKYLVYHKQTNFMSPAALHNSFCSWQMVLWEILTQSHLDVIIILQASYDDIYMPIIFRQDLHEKKMYFVHSVVSYLWAMFFRYWICWKMHASPYLIASWRRMQIFLLDLRMNRLEAM